jgi:hypothetical protein
MSNLDADKLILQAHHDQLLTQSRQMMCSLDDAGRDDLYNTICDMQNSPHDSMTHAIGLLAHAAFTATTLHVANLEIEHE